MKGKNTTIERSIETLMYVCVCVKIRVLRIVVMSEIVQTCVVQYILYLEGESTTTAGVEVDGSSSY